MYITNIFLFDKYSCICTLKHEDENFELLEKLIYQLQKTSIVL